MERKNYKKNVGIPYKGPGDRWFHVSAVNVLLIGNISYHITKKCGCLQKTRAQSVKI